VGLNKWAIAAKGQIIKPLGEIQLTRCRVRGVPQSSGERGGGGVGSPWVFLFLYFHVRNDIDAHQPRRSPSVK